MKKIDISDVTPFDKLYITDLSRNNEVESVSIPKYMGVSEIVSLDGNILDEINKKIKFYIKINHSCSQIDFFYDNYEGNKKCDYGDIRSKIKANKYMEYLLSNSVMIKLDSIQHQVVGTLGESALDVVSDMYDVYGQDEYYEFLDDFMNYIRNKNIKKMSRK